jgi:molecular chaperone DnaK
LSDIPPAPRGVPKIDVTFDIDANGIVHVSAKEQTTGKEQKITITGSSSLNKDEINNAVEEAEKHAAEDAARRDKAEAKNSLDQVIFQSEKFLEEQKDKIGETEKGALEASLKEAKEALESDDIDRHKTATDALTQAYQAAGSSVYAQAAQAEHAGAQPSGSDYAGYDDASGDGQAPADGAVEGEVVEGEVEEK